MMVPRLRVALLFAALAAGAALLTALGSERWGGLVPCALCLVERWPYRIVLAVGLVGLFLPRRPARLCLAVAGLAVLAGAGVAGVHVGVEQGWWPSPLPECAAPRFAGGSLAERLASMPAAPGKPCEDPTYPLAWLPVSFAQANLAYALALSAAVAMFLWRTRRSAP